MTQTMTATIDATAARDLGRSICWETEEGPSYCPVLLSHQSAEGYAIVGVAVLAMHPSKPFAYPTQLAQELSHFAYESGDVSAFIVDCGTTG
jgi:hypothetical protein